MAYTRGESKNIIVGAAALFLGDAPFNETASIDPPAAGEANYPLFVDTESYKETATGVGETDIVNVGYTSDGIDLSFEPDFGEVNVDQVLDVAKLFKQGMQVNLKTSFAEATLENLLIALAYDSAQLAGDSATSDGLVLNLSAGELGECPVERGVIAVGPGTGDCSQTQMERVYIAYRALSIESVSATMKRDEASTFEVSFRLLPSGSGSYGKIVDRTWT